MVSPTIALRFRDTTVGVDTIDAHQAIISKNGQVWWGWWKKDFEDGRQEYFGNASGVLEILIVDRHTKRMFKATSTDHDIGDGTKIDVTLVPDYYRLSAKTVHGWFLLTSIEPTTYSDIIAGKFGDSTLIVLNDESTRELIGSSPVSDVTSKKSSILYLSDLHFGSDYAFFVAGKVATFPEQRLTLTDCIIRDLERIGLKDDIEAILITGDFTSHGIWEDQTMIDLIGELSSMKAKLGIENSNLLVLPGNHDVNRYSADQNIDVNKIALENQISFKHERNFRFFISSLLHVNVNTPLDYIKRIRLRYSDVLVGILNSCRILATEWTEYGFIGPTGLDVIEGMRSEPVSRNMFRIIAMHHHLLPVTDVEAPNKKGVTLSLDASIILETAQKSGVHIAIHGHQHTPRLTRYQSIPLRGETENEPITVISNGSSGVSQNRLPSSERNTYCVMTFTDSRVSLRMREIKTDGRQGQELFHGDLKVTPAVP